MKNIINNILDDHIEMISSLKEIEADLIEIATDMTQALKDGNKIMLCGNGGSAADAQHISTEFVVRLRSDFNRKSLPAIALTTNTSLLTACANDYGFTEIFARQVEAIGNKGDYLVGISTSGNSENIFKAIKRAKENNIDTILITGKDGGKIKNIVDKSIIIANYNTARIQEAHITVGHILCLLIEKLYFNKE